MTAPKSNYYWKSIADLKLRLRSAVPHEELLRLHRRQGWRHLLYAARQFAIVASCSVVLWRPPPTTPLAALAVAVLVILQGFTFFNMTVLLHDAVHSSIFQSRRPRWNRVLGVVYAITSGISASQF